MTFLKSTILFGFLLTLLACGSDPTPVKTGDDGAEQTDEEDTDESEPAPTKDAGSSPSTPKDAGSSPSTPKDAGTTKPEARDSGSVSASPDAGAQSTDAGKPTTAPDAGTAAGGGFMFPDLFPAPSDAGTTPTPSSDGGTAAPGTRDVNGPCKDLELFCFDPFDMFIFNPSDCVTCNGGKGCQGCAIPFAY
jgi:hypothetical protein